MPSPKRFHLTSLLLCPLALPIWAQTEEPWLTRPDLSGYIPECVERDTLSATPPLPAPDLSGDSPSMPEINLLRGPWVFREYRNLLREEPDTVFPDPVLFKALLHKIPAEIALDTEEEEDAEENPEDASEISDPSLFPKTPLIAVDELPVAFGSSVPDWLQKNMDDRKAQEDFMYGLMIDYPQFLEYTYWTLPVPPKLPKEDYSFKGYLKRLQIPGADKVESLPVHASGERINWLHQFNIALQLSQAYVSSNWYQGGNSHLAFMGNFLWDVLLNPVYYPNLMFQSTVSYKMALNSTTDDQYHKYSVSEDVFQYNLKLGYKAVHNWYYTFLTQFKTQFLNNYASNSEVRTASFLSPGELNLGLGMTYSKENEKKTVKISASISPISYNLKTCIDPKVDHAQFNIPADRRWQNEIGSNGELNFSWQIWTNISYSTRVFLFTDYKTFQGDWQNTFNFQFNRFFSTQLYAHLRYDSSADCSINPAWKKWMMREILSVGLSYSFSTK